MPSTFPVAGCPGGVRGRLVLRRDLRTAPSEGGELGFLSVSHALSSLVCSRSGLWEALCAPGSVWPHTAFRSQQTGQSPTLPRRHVQREASWLLARVLGQMPVQDVEGGLGGGAGAPVLPEPRPAWEGSLPGRAGRGCG